jgi:hypothetical protein
MLKGDVADEKIHDFSFMFGGIFVIMRN